MPTNDEPILQSRLEGEAEKDAMQKSDAAREAFLAELAKDEKKSSGSKEVENVKQARGKAKEKRKLKDQKKLKDMKVSARVRFLHLPDDVLLGLLQIYCFYERFTMLTVLHLLVAACTLQSRTTR